MTMANEYLCNISGGYLQKWPRYDIKHVKKQELFTQFRDFTVILQIVFLTDFDPSKGVLMAFSRSSRKSDIKPCIAALYPDFVFA